MYEGRLFVCGRQSEETDVPNQDQPNTEQKIKRFKKKKKVKEKKEEEEKCRRARPQKNNWAE